MFNFRKIPAKSAEFAKLWNRLSPTLNKYESFLEIETQNNPLAQSKETGKSSSYSLYLRRLYIIITEVNQFKHLKIDDLEFVNILKQMKDTKEFKKYNIIENYFPSATINSYIRFFNQKLLHEDDFLEIADYNNPFSLKENRLENEFLKNQPVPKEIKPEKFIETVNHLRSAKEKNHALYRANWKCEYNSDHTTFLNKYNNKQYLEAHHLIPIGYQPNYEYSLDIFTNIIILCPRCHRFIHYGRNEGVKKMLQYFYEDREEELKMSNIIISFNELLELYGG